jgi:hypothetical protein
MAVYNIPHFSSLLNFWIYVLFLLNWRSLLYTSCVLGLHPSALYIEIDLLIKECIHVMHVRSD